MKGNTALTIGIAAILIVGGLFLANQMGWIQLWTIYVQGCPLVTPEFGRIECEPISHSPITLPQISFGASDYGSYANYRVKCGDDENTPNCDFIAECNGKFQVEFWFQISNPAYGCPIGGSKWCYPEILSGTPTKVADGPVGTIMQIGACKEYGLIYYSGKTSTRFLGYGLNVYDSGAKYRYNTQSCTLDDWNFVDRNNVVSDCGGVPNCIEDLYGVGSNILGYDDWVNYVSGFQYAPEGINSGIVIWNNQEAWCHVNKVWNIEQIDTVGGCYRVPTEVLDDVDCCPGMQGPNVECGSDYKWHQISTDPQCNKVSVAQCYGAGQWVTDYVTPEMDVTRAIGLDGLGCCIYESKLTECVPPNVGCPSGYVCSVDTFTCVKQEGPGVECGDGVCSSPYENSYNCPQDCGTALPFDINILWIIILAVLFLLIGYLAKGAVGAAIGAIIGGIIGYLIFIIISWWGGMDWWQQTLIAIGGFAGGGIMVYLFGGTFITFILVLIYAWRK